jgi:hypothetical protein
VENPATGRRSHHAAESREARDATVVSQHADPPERSSGPGHADGAEDRRARHGEPAEVKTSGEFLSRHRELLEGLPAIQVGRDAEEPLGEAGLADLLAEALVAYETGRRGQDGADRGEDSGDARFSGRHGASAVSGITSGPDAVSSRPVPSFEDSAEPVARARHRHSADAPQSWTPRGR